MSLILDALRKSEAERRRGQAPDLFAPMATARGAAPATHRSPWRLVAAAVLVLALLAAAGLWRRQPSADIAPTAATSPPGSGVSPAAAGAASARVPASTAPASAAAAAPPFAASRRADDVAGKATPSPSKDDQDVRSTSRPPAPQPESAPAPASPAVSLDAASAGTPDNARPDAPRLPRLGDLDPALRASLPPLKLSMHVWAEDPDQRFAIIDGQRVTEGSELSGTLVREIRRDGVLLSIGGRDVLLPR